MTQINRPPGDVTEKVQINLPSIQVPNRTKWWWIAAGVTVMLFIILWITVFSKKEDNPRIEALEQVIQQQQKSIETLQQYQSLQDEKIKAIDSAYKLNRQKETTIIHKYEKIPVDVRAYDRERLRSEVTNY